MKPDSNPKPAQHRLIRRQTRRYIRQGGRIRKLPDGTARGLCSIRPDELETLMGLRHEV